MLRRVTAALFFRHSSEILVSHFVDLVIEKQDMLSCKERWDGILALVPECILQDLTKQLCDNPVAR